MSAAEVDRYKDAGGSSYQGNGTPDDGGNSQPPSWVLKFCFSPTTLTKQQKLENWKGCDKTNIHVLCVTRINIDTVISEKSLAISSKTKFVISITFLLRT